MKVQQVFGSECHVALLALMNKAIGEVNVFHVFFQVASIVGNLAADFTERGEPIRILLNAGLYRECPLRL